MFLSTQYIITNPFYTFIANFINLLYQKILFIFIKYI